MNLFADSHLWQLDLEAGGLFAKLKLKLVYILDSYFRRFLEMVPDY